MRERRVAFRKFAMGLMLSLFVSGSALAQKNYQDLTYPKLSDIHVPEVEQVTLSNGMKLFVLEDHELPMISLSARIRAGSIHEPPEKVGLASMVGTVMRTGGTTSKTGEEIDEELEGIAASVETRIGLNSGSASMSVLTKDLETGLSILADILMNPAFPEEMIQLSKVRRRTSISRRNDSVGSIASREFVKLIYGPDSVYARTSEYATIDSITREDLISFHGKFFYPNNMMLAVWGDFHTPEMIRKIEEAFRGWEKREVPASVMPEVNYEFRQTVNFVQKDDVNQTNIYMGHIGGLVSDPDYFALVLMNRILGSGFTSRLFKEVRSRQGLAYSVFGSYSANFDYEGIFYIGCQTKSETTVQAIRALRTEVEKLTQSEVTDEELELARQSYLNAFVFNFDSRSEIVNRLMTYAYHGYPLDFLQTAKEKIERVTKSDILRVAAKHLHPDKMQIVAVGRSQDFDEPLSALGPMRELDITIPGQ